MGMRIYIYYSDTASRGKKQICKTSQRYARVYKSMQSTTYTIPTATRIKEQLLQFRVTELVSVM